MLYKFKSRASRPFVMLEPTRASCWRSSARTPERKGIVTRRADAGGHRGARGRHGARGTSNAHNDDDYAVEGHDDAAEKQHVGLRQRAVPLLHMLKDSLADRKDVIWEV